MKRHACGRIMLPPPIKQTFNGWLLDPIMGAFHDAFGLEKKALKKIRPQDKGRKREFDKLISEVKEMYEWYKGQKKIEGRKTSEEKKKRPNTAHEKLAKRP